MTTETPTAETAELRKYELMVIFSGELVEKDFEDELTELRKLLQDNTNGITYEDSWGKRELVTRIKKNKHGYYVFFNFTTTPANIKELSDPLKLNQKIIRTLLIVVPDNYEPGRYNEVVLPAEVKEEEKKPARSVARRTSAVAPTPTRASATEFDQPEEKLTRVAGKEEEEALAGVEKKLEDILDNPDIDVK